MKHARVHRWPRPVTAQRRGSPCRGAAAVRWKPQSRRLPTHQTSRRTGKATYARRPPHLLRLRPTDGDALAPGAPAGSARAAWQSPPPLPRCSRDPSAADPLPVLPTLARCDDDVCDRLEITWLADELRDRECGSRSVVAYERHGAASCVAVELERAVRPAVGAWDGANGVGHNPAIPGGSVAQSSPGSRFQRQIDHDRGCSF